MEMNDKTGKSMNGVTNLFAEIPPEKDGCPRILSLDGGGVRGLSSLLILRSIMEEIVRRTNTAEALPCQYFDLIGGTGTGGWIAIMLGRLRMVMAFSSELIAIVCRRMYRRVHRPIKESFRSRSGPERRNPRW